MDVRNILFLYTLDVCPELVEACLYILIATVYLPDVLDAACAFGTHSCDEQGDTCTDIGACHAACTELDAVVLTHDDGAVRVAEDDLRAHVDELVDEEETALEHLLMDKHGAAGLGGYDEEHGEQVRRRPGHGASASVMMVPSMNESTT